MTAMWCRLATVCPSEEIDEWYFQLASACLVAAAVLVVVSFTRLVISKPGVRRCAMAGLLFAIFPFAFAWNVHSIDFVAVAHDGTPASGPLWKVLVIPGLPMFGALLAITAGSVRRWPPYSG